MDKKEILDTLRRGICEIQYVKKNGELRFAQATLNPQIITEQLAQEAQLDSTRFNNAYNDDLFDHHVVYFDLGVADFRIFFVERVKFLSAPEVPKQALVEFSEEEFIQLGPRALEAYRYLQSLGFAQQMVGVSHYHGSKKVMRMPIESEDKIGIELELYHARDIQALSIETKAYGIGLEHDGSLAEDGVELVTPVVDFSKIGAFITVLKRLNRDYGDYSNFEESVQYSGIHLHFDLNSRIKRRFLTAWFIMNGFCLPVQLQRRTGHYSLPLPREHSQQYFEIDSIEKYRKFRYFEDNKLHGLNATIRNYGVEFRGLSSGEMENLAEHVGALHDLRAVVDGTFDNTATVGPISEEERMRRFQIANLAMKVKLEQIKNSYAEDFGD